MTVKESLQIITKVWTEDETSPKYPNINTIKDALYTITKELKYKAKVIDRLTKNLEG